MNIDQTQLAHLLMVLFVCLAGLLALVLVLRHRVSMRATDAEVGELKRLWNEGSKAIAEGHAKLDKNLGALKDDFQNLRNRIGK